MATSFPILLVAKLFFKNNPIENFATAVLNLLQWTYGTKVLQQSSQDTSKLNLRSIFINPIMLGTVVGLLLFLTNVGTILPNVLKTALNGITAMNTPLALLIIPAISALILMLLHIESTIKYALLIVASCPVGANVAVYAYASKMVVLSTSFSILTLPIIVLLGGSF